MKRVLVVNAGSSSLKWSVLTEDGTAPEAQGGESWQGIGKDDSHLQAMRRLLQQAPSVDAIGHRVVHGGMRFRAAVLVDDAVLQALAQLTDLAPLHNPAALAGMHAARDVFPRTPQIAAFDTAFHHTIPAAAAEYGLPREWSERFGLRRFGFHGLSVSYVVRRCTSLLGTQPRRLIVCHLGAGCSATAVLDGRSVDTTMGFTPLEGLIMATRAGSVDPGLLLYLLMRRGISAQELDDTLNHRSGLLGISGVSADFRVVLEAAEAGNAAAALAYATFRHRLAGAAGALVSALGGLDALAFTAGIGEHSARVRADLAADLAFLGVRLDGAANERRQDDQDVALAGSAVRLPVITAREDLAILGEVRRVLQWQ